MAPLSDDIEDRVARELVRDPYWEPRAMEEAKCKITLMSTKLYKYLKEEYDARHSTNNPSTAPIPDARVHSSVAMFEALSPNTVGPTRRHRSDGFGRPCGKSSIRRPSNPARGQSTNTVDNGSRAAPRQAPIPHNDVVTSPTRREDPRVSSTGLTTRSRSNSASRGRTLGDPVTPLPRRHSSNVNHASRLIPGTSPTTTSTIPSTTSDGSASLERTFVERPVNPSFGRPSPPPHSNSANPATPQAPDSKRSPSHPTFLEIDLSEFAATKEHFKAARNLVSKINTALRRYGIQIKSLQNSNYEAYTVHCHKGANLAKNVPAKSQNAKDQNAKDQNAKDQNSVNQKSKKQDAENKVLRRFFV